MLCEIGYNGSRFNELDEALDISHQTLSVRLSRAEYLLLVENEVVNGERGKSTKYVLSNRGKHLLMSMEHTGLVHYHYELKDARAGFDEARDHLIEPIADSYMKMEEELGEDGFVPIAPPLYTTTDPAKEENNENEE